MHPRFRWFLYTFLAIAIGFMGHGIWFVYQPGACPQKATVYLSPHDLLEDKIDKLAQAGIQRVDLLYVSALLYNRFIRSLKPGEYTFTPAYSLKDILKKMSLGRTNKYSLTIPEGWTVSQILQMVNRNSRLVGRVLEPIEEGTLMPATYVYETGMHRQDLLYKMKKEMDRFLGKISEEDLPPLVGTKRRLLILASIVERETAKATERPRIAGLFLTRLKKRMRLQSDPTVIYAITQGQRPLGRPLLKSDIKSTDSPYNTYRYGGLPPGPIACPGKEAVQAVMKPLLKGDHLYFVADGTGGHKFSKTLDEHNKNVRQWRKIQKKTLSS